MFRGFTKMEEKHQLLFAFIIGIAVIAFWRGAWGIMDVYLLPEEYELSSWISLIAGILVLVATHYTTKELT